jgi:hypothetical protein
MDGGPNAHAIGPISIGSSAGDDDESPLLVPCSSRHPITHHVLLRITIPSSNTRCLLHSRYQTSGSNASWSTSGDPARHPLDSYLLMLILDSSYVTFERLVFSYTATRQLLGFRSLYLKICHLELCHCLVTLVKSRICPDKKALNSSRLLPTPGHVIIRTSSKTLLLTSYNTPQGKSKTSDRNSPCPKCPSHPPHQQQPTPSPSPPSQTPSPPQNSPPPLPFPQSSPSAPAPLAPQTPSPPPYRLNIPRMDPQALKPPAPSPTTAKSTTMPSGTCMPAARAWI